MYRVLIALALLIPSPALAWWEYGHATVATIAMSEASPRARAEIRDLIRHAPELSTPSCPIRTIEDASVWPDCIKTLKERFSYAYAWHYQDVDICKPFDLAGPCKDGNCVSAQIIRNAKLLGDRSLPPRERLMALAFLVHFVGDLHQPLHAGEHDDKGGNDVKASYGIVGHKRMNLHAVWDGYLAERAISTPPSGARGLLSAMSSAERASIAKGSVEDWSRESWQLSHDQAYAIAIGGDPCGSTKSTATLDETSIEALIPVVRTQIDRAGLRLARLLHEALDPHGR